VLQLFKIFYWGFFQQITFNIGFEDIISINTDTGAAMGKYLSALGFNSSTLENNEILVYQVAAFGRHRGDDDDVWKMTYKFDSYAFEK